MAKQNKKAGRFSVQDLQINTGLLVRVLISAVFVFMMIYSILTLSNINAQLAQKEQELNDIRDQIEVQEIKNEEMNKLYGYSGDELSAYIEQLARDELDYIKQGERVFVNVSGD